MYRHSKLLILLAGALMAAQASAEQILFYNFNDASNPAIARDSSGKGNDGDVIEATYTADRGGRTGLPGDRAMDFGDFNNGAYVDVSPAASGALDSLVDNDQFTLAMWILGNDEQPVNQWTFYAGPDRDFGSHIPWGDSTIYFDVAGCCGTNQRINKNEPDPSLYKNVWNHYAFVKNETYTAIYQNGALWHDSGVNMKDPLRQITEFYIGSGPNGGASYSGLIDDVGLWDRALPEAEIAQLAVGRPPVKIGGAGTIGNLSLGSRIENPMFGPPEIGPGILQSWYSAANPGNKDGVDAVADSQEPVVPAFRASHGSSWWTGNQAPFTADLVKYPVEVIGDTFNENDNSNYVVKASGQLFIPESGTYRFSDGIDDYTYFAVDTNKSGVAGDAVSEVLIDDNSWTGVFRNENNGGAGLGEATINVAAAGEWLNVEFAMAEGGGTDAGIIYWDYNPNAPAGQRLGGNAGFPDDPTSPIDPTDAETMYIPNSHLRSDAAALIKADRVGRLPNSPGGFEFDLNGDTNMSDMLVVTNSDPNIFTTKLDVNGITFILNGIGNLQPGESFQIVNANMVSGTPVIVAGVAGQTWTYNPATGRVTFGAGPLGDYNNNGSLDAGDLDLQSDAIATNNLAFDLTGDGKTDYGDRLHWVSVLKKTWIGDADLNGEFNSSDLVAVFTVGKYETGQPATWTEGDWDGNKTFSSSDFVAAFTHGGYELGPMPPAAVPEPAGCLALGLLGGLALLGTARRRG
jgi:hypothetical protein